ncbi:MAG: NAD-dependent epimerase/dehydratase family protein [Propionibacteriaceae bacterium]|jgi:nucleoside-diphosphate-sugar epimerase|nr:NAD-dependent epimerase/dehydratase family protein [Propionibacteriaceae bacterium]
MSIHILNSRIYRDDIRRVAELDLPWRALANTTLVLSGASGMIGSFLVDVLMAHNTNGLNCTIHALARDLAGMTARFAPYEGHPNLKMTSVDLNGNPLDFDQGDWVIHAASNTHPLTYSQDPIGTITTNVHGTFSMLDLAARTEASRTLFLSTVEIYGDNRSGIERFTETDMGYIDCNTLRAGYPESKRTGEALCQAFSVHHSRDVVIPRLPRVFGPTMKLNDSKALSQFLLKAVAGENIVLKSEGNQYFSYLHVGDVVSGILTCLFLGGCRQAYNLAHPSGDIHLKDLAAKVAGKAGLEVVFELPSEAERAGYSVASRAVMDGGKMADLGWKPLFDLDEGIERTIAILREITS